MSGIRKNRAKHKLKRGEIVTTMSGLHTGDIIDYLGPSGFDAVWIETEHGAIDFADIPDLTRAAEIWGMTPLVRVNLNLPGVIYRTLDVGAQGIVEPHVNTAEEARSVVEAAKFAPIGSRGLFTSRQGYGVDDYLDTANDETLIVVLIEDIVAVNNLAEILTVDHIDVFFVASSDLAQSMGYIGQENHPDVVAIADAAIAQITAAGRVAGASDYDPDKSNPIEKGARFLLASWNPWLLRSARHYIQQIPKRS